MRPTIPPSSEVAPPAERGTGQPQPLSHDDDTRATLRRIEALLQELRAHAESVARPRRHREFSLARLFGAILQALVVGLIIAAAADWAFQAPLGSQLVKLVFGGVLQLGALTAFTISRDHGS